MKIPILAFALLTGVTVCAQSFDFNAGQQGWTLSSSGTGTWDQQKGCLTLSSTGGTSTAWQSAPALFKPLHVYRMRFQVRGEQATGTVMSGTPFANIDVTSVGTEWREVSNLFVAPEGVTKAPIRLGQWFLTGKLFFDDVQVTPVTSVYACKGDLALGEGERIDGHAYLFHAPLNTEARNHSRPLKAATAYFNSDRWCLSDGTWIIYQHQLPNRKWVSANLSVNCGYYAGGQATIEESSDGATWKRVGVITQLGTVTVSLTPEVTYIRLRGEKKCSLQIHAYEFSGTTTGEPLQLLGATQYMEVENKKPEISVDVHAISSVISGHSPEVELDINTAVAMNTQATFTFQSADNKQPSRPNIQRLPLVLKSGQQRIRLPYTEPGCGTWEMTLQLGDFYTTKTHFTVPDYYDATYGEMLPSKNSDVSLWCASSGWKVPKQRALPGAKTRNVEVKLAKNEWEATQVIIKTKKPLTNVRVKIEGLSELKVDILRVGYVPVGTRTDKTSVLTDWPDPLLPTDKPFSIEAGENQPLWIRIRAPKGIRATAYRGNVIIEADGAISERVRMDVQVYDFTLPDTMTCETAFGFGHHQVKDYHRLTTKVQEQEVYAKYLQSLAHHRLSPYNPDPLAEWHVRWEGFPPWKETFTTEKVDGRDTLKITDVSETANTSASYQDTFRISEKGFRISFTYKTDKDQTAMFTFNNHRTDGSWISGHNIDQRIPGSTEWKHYTQEITRFPKEAASCALRFWGAGYQEPGKQTGTLWVSDLSVIDLSSGKNLIAPEAFKPVDANSIKPVFEWTRWDAAMEFAFTNYHFNTFRMAVEGLGGGTFQSRNEPMFMGYTEDRPEYHILLEKYLKGIESHLVEKGWIDNAYIYWFDEPDPKDYAFVMNGFNKLKKYAPRLRRMLTEQVENGLTNGPNLWCPLTPSLQTPMTEARRTAGDQFWWYVCCGPKEPYITEFIDHPGTEMRLWLWQTWKERVTGILIWETVYWTSSAAYPNQRQNPYLDPMSWVSDYDFKPGTKLPWGNGDGRFLYPPLAAVNTTNNAPIFDNPVDSYRLELLRDGIEDYEYFVMLQRLLAKKGPTLRDSKRKAYKELLIVPSEITSTMTTFTKDPRLMEAHRDKLARAIEDLSRD
ncbi:MAG: glycoside hydrolase domain-containing protein [bacterium]